MIELNKIYNEDCLEGMKRIPDNSVDCIICDLPYGTTGCKWDTIIPFDKLWEQYNRIVKEKGAVCLFADEPFTSKLILSNIKRYKYKWVWVKEQGKNFQLCKKMPLKITEDVCIFGKGSISYNPQNLIKLEKPIIKSNKGKSGNLGHIDIHLRKFYKQEFTNYPKNVLFYSTKNRGLHPTQKPVDLIEYLIKTYSNEGETILDNCMGSGTTAIACINTKRNYIGFEIDKEYYDLSIKRIERHEKSIQTNL